MSAEKNLPPIALEVIAESIKRGEQSGTINLPSESENIEWELTVKHAKP